MYVCLFFSCEGLCSRAFCIKKDCFGAFLRMCFAVRDLLLISGVRISENMKNNTSCELNQIFSINSWTDEAKLENSFT